MELTRHYEIAQDENGQWRIHERIGSIRVSRFKTFETKAEAERHLVFIRSLSAVMTDRENPSNPPNTDESTGTSPQSP